VNNAGGGGEYRHQAAPQFGEHYHSKWCNAFRAHRAASDEYERTARSHAIAVHLDEPDQSTLVRHPRFLPQWPLRRNRLPASNIPAAPGIRRVTTLVSYGAEKSGLQTSHSVAGSGVGSEGQGQLHSTGRTSDGETSVVCAAERRLRPAKRLPAAVPLRSSGRTAEVGR